MAIFKTPRATTSQRSSLLLEVGEIVYDTDQKAFYGGNGISLGGFLVGSNAGFIVERIVLTQDDINNKYVYLNQTPLSSNTVQLIPEGGISQVNGVDFIVEGNKLRWDGLGLDNFLEENDVLIIQH